MVESCKVGLDHWLDCHQRTQGTIVAAWDNSFSGVKLCLIKRCYVVMQRHGVVMGPQAVCTVTAELSRPEGKTMGIGRQAGLTYPPSCKSQTQTKIKQSHFQSTTLKKSIPRKSKVLPLKLHFKTSLTSPRPQSRLQTQTGCWRQQRPQRHGRGMSPDFVPDVPIQRLRGGRSDWLQGSSCAHALRGDHSIQLKLEKQAVSEAKLFRQDRQAVLS